MTRVLGCRTDEPAAVSIDLSSGERLTYRCDLEAHCVTVTNRRGEICFAFGGHGSRPGEFDLPMDVTVVAPEFEGEHLPVGLRAALWLAVADYGNRRVQIFELDGALVGTVEDIEPAAIGQPCGLRWRAPLLDVDGVDGGTVRIHLAAALLYGTTPFLLLSGPVAERLHRERRRGH